MCSRLFDCTLQPVGSARLDATYTALDPQHVCANYITAQPPCFRRPLLYGIGVALSQGFEHEVRLFQSNFVVETSCYLLVRGCWLVHDATDFVWLLLRSLRELTCQTSGRSISSRYQPKCAATARNRASHTYIFCFCSNFTRNASRRLDS